MARLNRRGHSTNLSLVSTAVFEITTRETTCMTDRLVDAGAGAPGTSRLARLADVGSALRRRFRHGPWLGVLVAAVAVAPAANAAETRHFERVSPADKAGGEIAGEFFEHAAAADGNAALMQTRVAFGDAVSSGKFGLTHYIARRTPTGWVSHGITPKPRADAVQTVFAGTYMQIFSEDLDKAIIWAYDLPGATDDIPDRNNIYQEDTKTNVLRTVSVFDPAYSFPFFTFFTVTDWAHSADGQHVALNDSGATQLTSAPVDPSVRNVYQWDDGVISLAGILPDGSIPPDGSRVYPENYNRSMSSDGRRLLFTAAATAGGATQIYQRIDGQRTAWISEPEGSDSSLGKPNFVGAATPDGHNVFFTTEASLLESDTNSGADIYRWTDSADPTTGSHLTLITTTGDMYADPGEQGMFGPVVGVSDDGEIVYYRTPGNDLLIWDHGATRLISGNVRVGDVSGVYNSTVAASIAGPGYSRVSPDGNWLALLNGGADGSDFALTGERTNGHTEMYLYNRAAGKLTCASCGGSATSDATVSPAVTGGEGTGVPSVIPVSERPRYLSADGEAFFSTADALVPEDTNGESDTYAFDGPSGTLRLLSSGKGSGGSMFADADVTGDNVFFFTRQRLVASDRDDANDLYTARTGPGLPDDEGEPAASPCDGDACQPPPTPSPRDDTLTTLPANGNVTASSRPRFTVAQRARFRGSVGTLKVRLLTPGTITWRAKGVVSGRVVRTRPGTYALHLRLTKRARALLAKNRTYSTTALIRVTNSMGRGASASARLAFTASPTKGR